MARTFCFIPFGTGGGEEFVASVAIEEPIEGLAGGGEGQGSLIARFQVEVATFGSLEDRFFDELPLQVFTMILGLNRA